MTIEVDPDLRRKLTVIRAARRTETADDASHIFEAELERTFHASRKLAVYGTLRPGRSNAHRLEVIGGTFERGFVRGALHPNGTCSTDGFPGFVVDEGHSWVELFVFHSERLPEHWHELDAFEGAGYRRVLVACRSVSDRIDVVNLYEADAGS